MATAAYVTGERRMTVGGVLSRAIATLTAAPAMFFGASFVIAALPLALFGVAMRSAMSFAPTPGVNPFAQIVGPVLLATAAWLLCYFLAQAVLFRAAIAVMDGRALVLGEVIGAGLRALPLLTLLGILLTIAVYGAMIFLIAPGVILAVIWSVAAPALVIERIGVFGALGRSRYLTKGARWAIFGLFVLVFVIYFFASSLLGIGTVAINGVATTMAARLHPSILSQGFSVVLQTLFVAVFSAIQAALYADLRDWKDGPAGDRLASIFS
jgi:hypothetical protein